jgi:hypothetical protein
MQAGEFLWRLRVDVTKEISNMFMKQIAVVGSVLVLGGYLVASDDALAAGQSGLGQRPSQAVKNGTRNLAGPQTKPPSNSFSGSLSSGSTIRNGNNTPSSKPVLGYGW